MATSSIKRRTPTGLGVYRPCANMIEKGCPEDVAISHTWWVWWILAIFANLDQQRKVIRSLDAWLGDWTEHYVDHERTPTFGAYAMASTLENIKNQNELNFQHRSRRCYSALRIPDHFSEATPSIPKSRFLPRQPRSASLDQLRTAAPTRTNYNPPPTLKSQGSTHRDLSRLSIKPREAGGRSQDKTLPKEESEGKTRIQMLVYQTYAARAHWS